MLFLSKIKLAEKFGLIFWIWLGAITLMSVYVIFQVFSHNFELPKRPLDSIAVGLYIAYILFVTACTGTGFICRFEFNRDSKSTAKQHKMMIGLMIGTLFVFSLGLVVANQYSIVEKFGVVPFSCNSILTDSSLYRYGSTSDSRRYIIERMDSINVTGMDCNSYTEKKLEVKKELLQRCDARLLQDGYYPYAHRILRYFEDGDSNRNVLLEFINDYFLRIEENTYAVKAEYYYKVILCVARENSLDSLADIAMTKYCVRGVVSDLVSKPMQKAFSVTTSLPEILQTVCVRCPDNRYVQQIKLSCGGKYDCDSIYFRSGKYELSLVSKLILECFFRELQKSDKTNFTVDFYGFTDSRKMIPIPYTGGGAYSQILCTLLPDPNYSLPMDSIKDNKMLSFARAHSCYDFMKKQFSGNDVTYRYTGCGVSDIMGIESRQRTVKIKITKSKN